MSKREKRDDDDKKNGNFQLHFFAATVCCYLSKRVHWHIRFLSLTSLYAHNSFCLLAPSHVCVCVLLLLFFWNSVIEHKLQRKGDVIAIELRINCSEQQRERKTHTHALDNKTRNGNCQWNSFFFSLSLYLYSISAFCFNFIPSQLNFFPFPKDKKEQQQKNFMCKGKSNLCIQDDTQKQ